jgi:hypothetical protein
MVSILLWPFPSFPLFKALFSEFLFSSPAFFLSYECAGFVDAASDSLF